MHCCRRSPVVKQHRRRVDTHAVFPNDVAMTGILEAMKIRREADPWILTADILEEQLHAYRDRKGLTKDGLKIRHENVTVDLNDREVVQKLDELVDKVGQEIAGTVPHYLYLH